MKLPLDRRPVIVALAGPNGAGKTTFYHAHLRPAALRFVNADVIAAELQMDAYAAAQSANALRRQLYEQRESFVFETVFSDPVGDKLSFLLDAVDEGYNVILCFIGVSGVAISEQRIAMRVSQGGHDVSPEKLVSRYPRIMANLREAIRKLPLVFIYDNDDLKHPYRQVAVFQKGKMRHRNKLLPGWLKSLMPER